MKRKSSTHYELSEAKGLVRLGRYIDTKKSTSWLRNHGYAPGKAKDVVLSLRESEFVESLPPSKEGGCWADVYRCRFEDEDLATWLYVKFCIEDEAFVLVLLSCKEWGYGW